TSIDINIQINRINNKYGTHIAHINNSWDLQWSKSARKEYYALNCILKQEQKKSDVAQITSNINNRNKAIDGGERKFITSLLNRDKRTIVLDRVRTSTHEIGRASCRERCRTR